MLATPPAGARIKRYLNVILWQAFTLLDPLQIRRPVYTRPAGHSLAQRRIADKGRVASLKISRKSISSTTAGSLTAIGCTLGSPIGDGVQVAGGLVALTVL